MNKLGFLLIFALVTCFGHSACTQNNSSPGASPNGYIFKTNLRTDGASFYAMNKETGQIHYMLDYGDNSGVWRPFGQTLPSNGASYSFDVVERPAATSFYALDNRTGKVYYTDDNPANVGAWKPYGDILRENGVSQLQFEALGRVGGNSFYAFDVLTGQMYFMNDFGDNAGKWSKYGNQANL